MKLDILLQGALGRMGQAIKGAANERGHRVVSEVDLGDRVSEHFSGVNLAIDFSHHAATIELAQCAAQRGVPLLIGTTGHSKEEKQTLLKVIQPIPVMWTGNYSLGVNLLFHLTERASEILPNDYDVELIEIHHRFKRDAPSGTAEELLKRIRAAAHRSNHDEKHGRKGMTGVRTDEEIGLHALRGGDAVGEHTVVFAGQGERVELVHRATDRMIFARGAIHAAEWLIGKPAGLYDMRDVLEMK